MTVQQFWSQDRIMQNNNFPTGFEHLHGMLHSSFVTTSIRCRESESWNIDRCHVVYYQYENKPLTNIFCEPKLYPSTTLLLTIVKLQKNVITTTISKLSTLKYFKLGSICLQAWKKILVHVVQLCEKPVWKSLYKKFKQETRVEKMNHDLVVVLSVQ